MSAAEGGGVQGTRAVRGAGWRGGRGGRASIILAAAVVLGVAACGGGGGGGGATASARTIRTSGGAGLEGDGGDGGAVRIVGVRGADVRVLQGGSIETEAVDVAGVPDLGANPLLVTADLALTPALDGTVSGTIDGAAPATGLRIEAGATLTILASTGTTTTSTAPLLAFVEGVVVEGTLDASAGGIQMTARAVLIEAGARITATGVAATGVGDEARLRIGIESDGALVNRGSIDARGAEGALGGLGGEVSLTGSGDGARIVNLGTIDASGGRGTAGAGGSGGPVTLDPGFSFTGAANTGTILTRGGDGATRGGDGGPVEMASEVFGAVIHTGTIDASGGRGEDVEEVDLGNGLETLSGGRGGSVRIAGGSGSARVAGAIVTRGGDGLETGLGVGGRGGAIAIVLSDVSPVGAPFAVGDLQVSADLDTRGGRGARGGDGGPVYVGALLGEDGGEGEEEEASEALRPTVVLAGYREVDLSGGSSLGGQGGAAGGNTENALVVEPAQQALERPGVLIIARSQPGIGGALVNEVPIVARGGDADPLGVEGGRGGRGGGIELRHEGTSTFALPGGFLFENLARIDARGGAGVRGGAGGRFAYIDQPLTAFAANPYRGLGEVDISGGPGRLGPDGTGRGGAGGLAVLLAFPGAVVESLAPIRASGGDALDADGGPGGLVQILANEVVVRGEVLCNGGAGVRGGRGGGFEDAISVEGTLPLPAEIPEGEEIGGIVLQSLGNSTVRGARLSVAGGEGSVLSGAVGQMLIDAVFPDLGDSGEVLP